MSTEQFFGSEVIHSDLSTATVAPRPAATAVFAGTAPIGEVHATAEERAKYLNTSVIVKTREEAAAAFGPHQDGFTIPAALDAMFDQANANGIGEIEVINVFDPDTHASVADVSNLDIIGSFDAAGKPSGLKCAYASYQRFGRFSKILLAPGFTGLTGVRAELETIANRIRARAILDAPIGAQVQDVVEARGPTGSFDWNFNNRRLVNVWPWMKVVDLETGDERLDPYSSRFAGVWLRTIMDHGYHHSPSNQPIYGIEGTETPVLYIPGDKQSDVQTLRKLGVVTTEERAGKGPHTSGTRSSAYPTDNDMRSMLHAQFIEDVLDEELIHFLDGFKDRNGTPARLEMLEERVNADLALKASGTDPIIYGGEFRFDRQLTTKETVAQGKYAWQRRYAPVGSMETLTVHSSVDLDLIGNPLGLAA